MKITNKWKKAAYILSAAGVISLATFGIYNTVNAVNAQNQAQPADYSIIAGSSANEPGTGSGCSPYGCAACSVCTNLQYQQDNAVLPGSAIQYE